MSQKPPLCSNLLSVVIPTYNRKESLLRTLNALAKQTFPASDFEVIVISPFGVFIVRDDPSHNFAPSDLPVYLTGILPIGESISTVVSLPSSV